MTRSTGQGARWTLASRLSHQLRDPHRGSGFVGERGEEVDVVVGVGAAAHALAQTQHTHPSTLGYQRDYQPRTFYRQPRSNERRLIDGIRVKRLRVTFEIGDLRPVWRNCKWGCFRSRDARIQASYERIPQISQPGSASPTRCHDRVARAPVWPVARHREPPPAHARATRSDRPTRCGSCS